ncbi:hypothetical protein [Nonomuraea mesophila]|uniref:hypothetical protein n=1 Tax=Nonomuraea mesophila TaxID=2530382 RepID=UPI00140B5853
MADLDRCVRHGGRPPLRRRLVAQPQPQEQKLEAHHRHDPTQYNAEFKKRVDAGFRLTSIAVSPWGTYTAV